MAKPMIPETRLTEGDRVDLFQAYYGGKVVDITQISYEEFLCQAQITKVLKYLEERYEVIQHLGKPSPYITFRVRRDEWQALKEK